MADLDDIDLVGLRLLESVARLGSVSTAAAELGLSQQTASLRMRSLERRVGLTLLARSARGSRLTPAGTLVNEWASKLLDDAAEVAAGIASLRTHRAAHLRIAASLTVAEHLLPNWLVRLHDRQRRENGAVSEVELSAVNTDSVIARIHDDRADLGFIEGPYSPAGLRTRVIGRDELVVVVRPDHAWARRRSPVTAAVLARAPMVGREPGSGSRQWLEDALTAALGPGAVGPPAIEVSSAAAARAAVAAGLGPTVISSLAVADDLQLGRFRSVPVAGVDLARTLRAVWRGDPRPPAGPVRQLLELTRPQPAPRHPRIEAGNPI